MDRPDKTIQLTPGRSVAVENQVERPKLVTVAVVLFGISLAIRIYGELSFAYLLGRETGDVAFQFGRVAPPIIFYVFQGWILCNVAKGRNWSRIAMIVIVFLNVAVAYLVLANPLGQHLTSTSIVSFQIVAEVTSVILVLFSADYFTHSRSCT